jgi:hypothetical protein
MIRSTNLTASIQTAVSLRPGDSVTLNPQPLSPKPKPLAPLEVFANVKAAWNASIQWQGVVGPSLRLDAPPLYLPAPTIPDTGFHTEMETSDPTNQDNGGGGTGGAPVIDPSGSNGWRAGISPAIKTVLDTDPRSASRANSVRTPDPQDPDPYFGFQVPDKKGPKVPPDRKGPNDTVPSAPLIPLPGPGEGVGKGQVIDDPAPRIFKHKRDD